MKRKWLLEATLVIKGLTSVKQLLKISHNFLKNVFICSVKIQNKAYTIEYSGI